MNTRDSLRFFTFKWVVSYVIPFYFERIVFTSVQDRLRLRIDIGDLTVTYKVSRWLSPLLVELGTRVAHLL